MNNYHIKTTKSPNGVGQWDSTICEIYQDETKIGEYKRSYPSYANQTFCPVSYNGKDYALFSFNYTKISLMALPSCEIIELKETNLKDFCPVEIYVPLLAHIFFKKGGDVTILSKGKNKIPSESESSRNEFYSRLGFVSGCIWGDDVSWKLNLLDLSKIEEGEIWYIKEDRKKEWLYSELPRNFGSLDTIDLDYSYDEEEPFPSYLEIPTVKYIEL